MPQAIMTNHATQRIKDRVGLGKKSANKNAQKALEKGLTHAECKSGLKRYLDRLYLDYRNANNMRVYHRFVYLFINDKLITVLPLPKRFNDLADKLQKEKENLKMEKIKEIRSAYEALYEDLQVAAEDDYLEYLTDQFEPDERSWDTEEDALVQLHCIIGEVINSYDDDYVESVLDRCGVFDIMTKEEAFS